MLDCVPQHLPSQRSFFCLRTRFGLFRAIIAILIGSPMVLVCSAAAETTSLSLAQALSIARERNPLVAIARERTIAARGIHTQASLLPNPVLTATSENQPFRHLPGFSFATDTDDYVYASQLVELGGKRRLRLTAAQAGIDAAEGQAEIEARQLTASVSSAYWTADAAAQVLDLYRKEAATLARMVEYNGERVHAGASAGADLLRIQLESDRMLASANLASADASRTLIALYAEMGTSEFPSTVAFIDHLNSLEHFEAPSLDTVLQQRPEMLLAQAQMRQAKTNLSLERASAIPDPDLLFGYKRWSGYGQYSGINSMFFGVKTPLPLFNRNQGKVSSADAELRSAQHKVEAQKIAIKAELAAAESDYLHSRDALEQIMPRMTERAGRNLNMTFEAYRIGGTDLVRYLDAERMRVETQVLYVKALSQYHQSAINLQYAAGILR
jgi:cobalt-zinc-cadmium efflux system outer membrane protein